jgi:uncharacterized protein
MNSTSDRTPDELLGRYHAAMINISADDLADLYADDSIHEFPFFNPQGVSRLTGREQVRAYYRQLWSDVPVVLERIESTATHQTTTPGMIINELICHGRLRSTGAPFQLGGLIVLTARAGKIISVRDYMDLMGLAAQTSPAPLG